MAISLGLQANYELEGFEFDASEGVGDKYLPDFHLPAFDLWVECKPDEPAKREWAIHMAFQCQRRHAFCVGWPNYNSALDQFNYRFSRFDEQLGRTTDHLLAVCSSCSALSIVPSEWRVLNAPLAQVEPLAPMCDCIRKETARFGDARIMGALHLASTFILNWKDTQSSVWKR
ncbi:MAG: hypothetical protein R3E79_58245 [Caldilineaceae bacterium]